jgi:DNA invertase Pin-like site-specific DNA recombinase
MEGRFVSYLRVSTARQGRSGLGLEAQREAVAGFLNGGSWALLREFVEVESGRKSDRTELAKALGLCRLTGATLVIAKLDRLARDAAFLLNLRDAGVEFVCADMPQANRLTIGILALVAEEEARAISARTKAALAAAKARGRKLGGWRGGPKVAPEPGVAARRKRADAFAASVGPTVRELRGNGLSLRRIAAELETRGIRTAAGGHWTAAAVNAVLARSA